MELLRPGAACCDLVGHERRRDRRHLVRPDTILLRSRLFTYIIRAAPTDSATAGGLTARVDSVQRDDRKRGGRRQYAADPTIACRGCGLPLNDHGGGWSPAQQMDPDERAAYEAAEATWQERHASCRDDTASLHFRWGIAGSRTEHCMDCCPPPPMSPEQTKQVAGILADILVNATDRSDWTSGD